MARRLEPRVAEVPGPLRTVKVEISEQSFPSLLAGIEPDCCWLVNKGDGTYIFRATERLGDTRKRPGTPAADILVALLGDFAIVPDDAEDVPQRLRDEWERVIDQWEEQTGPVKVESD
jgi:hypothetical protein